MLHSPNAGGPVNQEWTSRSYWVDLKLNQVVVAVVCFWGKAEFVTNSQSICGAYGRPAEQTRSHSIHLSLAWHLQAEKMITVLNTTILLNASLPPIAGLTFYPQCGIRFILEAYFKVLCVFSNTISSYNLEMIFSFILINLLNKYANISSALYKNTYTQQTTPHNKSKINKNMYYITHMKWPSSFETIMKQLHMSHRT